MYNVHNFFKNLSLILFIIDTADAIAKDLLTAGLLEGRELVVGMDCLFSNGCMGYFRNRNFSVGCNIKFLPLKCAQFVHFLIHFLMLHVCRKVELISIKIGFFKLFQNRVKVIVLQYRVFVKKYYFYIFKKIL